MDSKRNEGFGNPTRTIALNVRLIGRVLDKRNLAWTAEKKGCLVSRATWLRLKNTGRVSLKKAGQIAEFLGFELDDLLLSDEAEEDFQWPQHVEWEPVSQDSAWERTSNGLCFYRAKVRHKHIGDDSTPVFGRARCYDLSRVPDRQRVAMREHLTRHPLVCRQLAAAPQFPANLSVAPVAREKVWWVVDEWIEGETLAQLLEQGPIAREKLDRIMRQVAEGLRVLHRHKIVLRELAPSRVLVGADQHVRLIELDLAKLLLGEKTVSTTWPDDVYRAPEVESGEVTPKADLFSWAMVYLHAATGDTGLTWRDADAINALGPKAGFKKLFRQCLSPRPSGRPESIEPLLKVLSRD